MRSLTDVNLELLRVFYNVAKLGSMTAASRALFITQPAISHGVSQLEENLQCRLFERVSRKLRLTDEGATVFDAAQRMMQALQEGERKLQEVRTGKSSLLRIGCPQLLLHTALTPMLAKFHEEHRGIKTKITIENRMAQMLDLVRNDEVELQFLATPVMDSLGTDLEVTTLGTYHYGFCASRRHFGEFEGKTLSWQEINALPLIVLRPGNNTRDYLERWFAAKGITLNVAIETETMAVTDELTKSGFGIGAMIVSDGGFADPKLPEELFEIKLEPKLGSGRYVMVKRRGSEKSDVVQKFLDSCSEIRKVVD